VWALLTHQTDNLGDDIQSLAALQHLPGASRLLDRELLPVGYPDLHARIILNGWWMHRPERLLHMRGHLDAALISMHFSIPNAAPSGPQSAREILRHPRVRGFLEAQGPVGCRDFDSQALLDECGIPSYFSGCLTTTLRTLAEPVDLEHAPILCVDVPTAVVRRIKRETRRSVTLATNSIQKDARPIDRLARAEFRLSQIQRARAVITTRLHAALPSLALGTPVVLIQPSHPDSRLSTFLDWLRSEPLESVVDYVVDAERSGWPLNPTVHAAFANEMTQRLNGWVGKRSGPSSAPTPRSLPEVSRGVLATHVRAHEQDFAEQDRLTYVRLGDTRTRHLVAQGRRRLRRLGVVRRPPL
jgi:hypothetical protein